MWIRSADFRRRGLRIIHLKHEHCRHLRALHPAEHGTNNAPRPGDEPAADCDCRAGEAMKPNRKKRLLRGGISAALAVVLAFSVPSSSWAYWSASASPQNPTLSARVVPVPAGYSCSSSGGLL